MPASEADDTIYQLHLALRDITPVIWRRVQVRGSTTLPRLHTVFQRVMGWTNSHLHLFRVGEVEYGMPDAEYPNAMQNERRIRLEEIVHTVRDRFVYEYDFGDCWQHDVMVEAVLLPEPGRHYPVCLDGARACPPEDAGGTDGYADFLMALGDPTHHEHQMMREWIGANFDPEAFDVAAINRALRPR